MNYLKLLFILLLVFPISVYGEGNDNLVISITNVEDRSDDYALLSSNESNDLVIHRLNRFRHLDLEDYLKGDLFSSPIYLIKKFELLMVIKFNTSFYAHFF